MPPEGVDSRRFERLIAEGRSAAEDGEWEASAHPLTGGAFALERRPAGRTWGMWAPGRSERARLDEQYRCAAEELAEAELARGRHRERLAFLHNLGLGGAPPRAAVSALLGGAVPVWPTSRSARAFQRARTSLGELGLAPGEELLSLEPAISARDLSIGPKALGRLSLTAVAKPDAAQDALADLEGQRPDRPRTFANNLPVELTSFVGRSAELAGVAAALHHARLVTVTGAGGVGKTRLAIRVAATRGATFPTAPGSAISPLPHPVTTSRVVAVAVGARIRPDLSAERSSHRPHRAKRSC